jgi:hypothetical protein
VVVAMAGVKATLDLQRMALAAEGALDRPICLSLAFIDLG